MARLSVADVLDRAADLIEPEGAWTAPRRGMQFPKSCGTPTCIGFAVEQAAKPGKMDEALKALYASAPFHNLDTLVRWNDAPERTQAEVVAALREAAELARARSAEFGNIGADGVQS